MANSAGGFLSAIDFSFALEEAFLTPSFFFAGAIGSSFSTVSTLTAFSFVAVLVFGIFSVCFSIALFAVVSFVLWVALVASLALGVFVCSIFFGAEFLTSAFLASAFFVGFDTTVFVSFFATAFFTGAFAFSVTLADLAFEGAILDASLLAGLPLPAGFVGVFGCFFAAIAAACFARVLLQINFRRRSDYAPEFSTQIHWCESPVPNRFDSLIKPDFAEKTKS
ncbi:MAG: hypothetical protein PHX61_06120 [Alphaproteobacteria bacterium]|nr:hypothetical protein [Alphaproteobacteria bacterium]